MIEWLLNQIVHVIYLTGFAVTLMLVLISGVAIWSAFKRQYFEYDLLVDLSFPWHVILWLWSFLSIALSNQMPDREEDEYWSLRYFDFDEFLLGLQISFFFHLIIFVIIALRLKFNSEN